MTYDEWEKERKELWERYVSHYKQSADGITAANIFVFEHCVLERRLCEEGLKIEDLTDTEKAQIRELDSHAVNIIDQLYMEAVVPLDARPSEVKCRRCNLQKRGYKVYINLPAIGELLHDEFCATCG